MDTAADAPADSTLDEQRPKGTPEQQLASFGPDSPEAAEPEEPEEEMKATAGADRSVGGAERDSAAAPVSPPASDRNATTSAQVKQTVRKLQELSIEWRKERAGRNFNRFRLNWPSDAT